ncbi:sigma-B regulation protein RsbU (phosphoserine phosphatase) [Pseudobutyrivibrio sp. UC1225]|uniref:PP2C family protein-serine/threonine phosphatase n=1 Tax=Pseudobutyrivibrio sp. UC1225 TaxID=1798185 RepID=UPI0008F1A2E0|nr:PP2C family protein-serine/threonine phosphatase [Pseudobutyrivibrio sp. UC1225]SFO01858.1 sigma-B regulation protein RsbU (phosphoserine phosphatase) [Pseudobutyrivibrio sp. UC1225]
MRKILKIRKFGIHAKALAGIIIFTLLAIIAMCISGSLIFNRSVQKLYNERGYVVANIILKQIDHDKIAEYSKTWYEDDYYQEMVEYLKYIQEVSDAAYIYIGVPYEDKTIKYIYDSGSNMGFRDPIAAPFDELWEAYTKGVQPKSYLVRHSQYGYLTSSCLPVKDSKGNVVALLFVDTYMRVVQSTLQRFIINMIIIALILLGAFCLLNWHYMNSYIIDPLMVLRRNIKWFAENTTTDDSLNYIKTGDELEELAKSVQSMEQSIVEYIDNIETITAEKERISAELNVATKIQADMLPRKFPPFPERTEFDIYATMTPAKEVGGDFYDFFLIDDDHLALVMADVSGKGVPAALFMVNAKTLIKYRALMDRNFSPSAILYDVNNQLCEGNDMDLFITVWLGIIQISTGKIVAANAGHEHPAIKRKDGQFELDVYKHSPAVATMDGITFREHEFQLNPGDSLFVYTDGVPEAANEYNRLYGTNRMLKALNKNPKADAKELLETVKRDIDGFVEDSPQFDDITMLCFKYF